MPQLAYPLPSDLAVLLASCGLIAMPPTNLEQSLGLENYIVSAQNDWDRTNGFNPFMAASAPTTQIFTPNQEYTLDLAEGDATGGLTAAPTSVTTGVTATSVGTVLTVNKDYFMRPANALAQGRSYTYIQFYGRQYGPRDSIRILGSWGGCPYQQIPQSVWDAINADGARRAYPQIEFKINQGVMSWKEGDVSRTFGHLKTLVDGSRQMILDAIAEYGRPVIS